MATINGTQNNDTLTGTNDADIINGFAGNDVIDGRFGADTLNGGAGNDTFVFSGVRDNSADTRIGLVDGGDGYDTIDWSRISPFIFDYILNADGDLVPGARVGSQKYEIRNIERMDFGEGDDFAPLLSGTPGLELHLGGGEDYVRTHAGNSIFGDAGDDGVHLSNADRGGSGFGSADGGAGEDYLTTEAGFSVDLAAGTATADNVSYRIANFENLEMDLGRGATTGLGDDKANILRPGIIGDDGTLGVTFDGRGGDDQIFGGKGNDVLRGGLGVDTVSYFYMRGAVRVDLAAGLATGGGGRDTVTGFENVIGSYYSDTIIGDSGRNTLAGEYEDDLLVMIDGARAIKPGGGFDTIDGGADSDTASLGGFRSDYQLLSSNDKIYLVTSGNAAQLSEIEYVRFGDASSSSVSELSGGIKAFDGLSYLASYSDLYAAFGTDANRAAAHFANWGFSEERSVTFNGLDYIASYQDLRLAFGADATAGARHFLQSGAAEQRSTTFDGWSYLASHSDLIRAYGADENAAARHYILSGAAEGRTTTFDAAAYGQANPDLVSAFGNDPQALARHYVKYGYYEGRSLSSSGVTPFMALEQQPSEFEPELVTSEFFSSFAGEQNDAAAFFSHHALDWTSEMMQADAFGFAV